MPIGDVQPVVESPAEVFSVAALDEPELMANAVDGLDLGLDGGRALEELEANTFDLLLTDQRMPTMDGLELLERAQRLQPRLPVILMTAYGTVSTAVEAMR